MTVARSRGALLLSNAVEITNGKQWQTNNPVSWNQGDSKTIYALWTISGYESDTITYLQNIGLNITVSGGHELEYYIQYEIGSNNYVETDWQSVRTPVNVAYRWDESSTYGIYVYVYVRRVDGEDLYYYDPETSRLFANGIRVTEQEISIEQTTALPPEWIENTTQTIGTQPTITTAVSTYNPAVVSEALEVPQKINVGMRYIGGIIQQFFELKYITFLCCFVIICALVAWLLH